MGRPIDEDDVIKIIRMLPPEDGTAPMVAQSIKQLPSAQPKSGQWVKHDKYDAYYDCSRCSCIAPCTETADIIIWKLSDFGPDCGARMQNTGKRIKLPSAEPERKSGKWIEIKCSDINPLTGRCGVYVGCSECGAPIPTDSQLDYIDESEANYCINCGEDMRGEKDV